MMNQCWVYPTDRVLGYAYPYDATTKKNVLAHRAVYEVLVGPIPEGLELDHLCRTRSCYNPRHLEPVTRSVNLRRVPRGATCPKGHERCIENARPSKLPRYDCAVCHRERNRKAA